MGYVCRTCRSTKSCKKCFNAIEKGNLYYSGQNGSLCGICYEAYYVNGGGEVEQNVGHKLSKKCKICGEPSIGILWQDETCDKHVMETFENNV